MPNPKLSSDLMLSSIIYLITDDEVSRQKQTMQMRSSRHRGGEHLSANRIIITYPASFRETGNIAPTSHARVTEIDTRIYHRQPVVLLPSLIMSCLRIFPWNEEQFIRCKLLNEVSIGSTMGTPVHLVIAKSLGHSWQVTEKEPHGEMSSTC